MENAKIFDYLKKFKNLPTYQFERRIDPFILPYLEIYFNKKFKDINAKFTFLYPEFPIERDALSRKFDLENKLEKLSDYVDYVMWCERLNTIYLVEFKTELNSLNINQYKTYFESCERGWHSLINYYFKKAIKNSYWRKFSYGLDYMHKTVPGILGLDGPFKFDDFIKKKPGIGIHLYLEMLKGQIKFQSEPKIKFMYLAPSKSGEELNQFTKLIPGSEHFYDGLISLTDFAESTEGELKELLQSIDKDCCLVL